MAERDAKTVILIDGKNALFRFGYAFKSLRSADGHLTGSVYGILNCMIRLKRKYPNSRFVMVWDGEGPSWRKDLYPEYKAGRNLDAAQAVLQAQLKRALKTTVKDTKLAAEQAEKAQKALTQLQEKAVEVAAVRGQVPTVEKLLNYMGIPQVCAPRVEADDLIGIIAYKLISKSYHVVIYSSDKDFMQLMPSGVTVIRDVDKEAGLAPESKRSVGKKFGCLPQQVLAVRALSGDPSDEIPNAVTGLGPKTAVKLVQAGVDPAQANRRIGMPKNARTLLPLAGRLYQNWNDAYRNYRLMRIAVSPGELPVGKDGARTALVEVTQSIQVCAPVKYMSLLVALADLNMVEALDNRHLLCRLQAWG